MESEPRVHVLLVDDQPGNLLALEAVLGGTELVLVRARSGEEALARVLDIDFAVILMDVQMPGMDGFETAALIRERDRSKHTPIIFLTAFQSSERQVFQGYALGAVDYLSKPIVPAVLKSKVAVFVELFQKTEQVRLQAAELHENQRREHLRELDEQKRLWELDRLREESARDKRIAEEQARRAEELARTVAERERAEEALALVRDELRVQLADMTRLHALSSRLSSSLELAAVLREVLAAVTGLQGTEAGVLVLRDRDRDRDTMSTAASLGLTVEQLAADDEPAAALDLDPAEAVTAVISGGIVVEGAKLDPVLVPHLAAARRAGYHAVCTTPLLTGDGEMVGSIATYFPTPHRPSDRETRLVELYARQAAQFIENARLYREIRDADRRKSEFLAMLAHELRNPLAPVLNALHLLRREGTESSGPVLEVAERQVRHLARLVEDLLDVSRISRGKIQLRKERVELREAVARAVEAVRPLIEARNHTLTVTLPDELVPLEADAARFEQVLANLLNNAAKYTEPGGRIAVEAGREGDVAVVRVRDTGIGIAPDLLPRIFDLFTQAERSLDRSQGGLGIGLTLVRNLVEMHGGSVTAGSAGIGQGSEFVVRLPLGAPEPADAPPEPAATCPPATSAPPKPRRVLVVDDSLDGARMLARLLQAVGHITRLAHDGHEALDAARAFHPEAIFLDIGLPGMDGYQVAERLREIDSTRHALIVALTGYGQEGDRRRSEDAGIDLHLVKPVDPEVLIGLLNGDRPLVSRESAPP